MPEQDEAEHQPHPGEQAPDNDTQAALNQADQGESDAAPLSLPAADLDTEPAIEQPDVDQPDAVQSSQAMPDIEESDATYPAPIDADDAQPEPVEPLPPVREPRRLSRAERDTIDRQQRRFAACGRCGYFLAGCRVYLGEEALQTAMLDARDGWLRLEGDEALSGLLAGSYGVQLDAVFDSFDGICPECRRRFAVVNLPDGPTRLKIRI